MDSFWSNVFKGKGKSNEGVLGILKKIPIFKDLSRRELAAVERILHRREYKPNEVIFYQEESGVGMYIIESGTVTVTFEPTDQVLAELRDGEFFGEMALLTESPRSATARAKTYCTLLFFSQADLLGLMEQEVKCGKNIVMELAHILGERLRLANEQNQSLQREVHTLKEKLNALEFPSPESGKDQ